MFPDGRTETMIDRLGMHHDTEDGAWIRRWSLMQQWRAGTISSVGPFVMSFVRHGNQVKYVRRVYEFL